MLFRTSVHTVQAESDEQFGEDRGKGEKKHFLPLFCSTFRRGLKVFLLLWVEYEK